MADDVGSIIKRARLRLGLTQRELSDQSHITRQMIDALEAGRVGVPSPDTLNKLCKILRFDMMAALAAIGYQVGAGDDELKRLFDEQMATREALDALLDRLHIRPDESAPQDVAGEQ